MTHPRLDPRVVQAVERAATEHLGRAWKHAGFTDLNHRATHPCGIFTGTPFSVFAKLGSSPSGEEQFTAELNGFSLIRSRTDMTTPVPVAGGIEVTSAGTLLVSEALAGRGAGSGQAPDSRTPGDYAAIGHTLARLHTYLAVIAVAGPNAFGRSFLPRLAAARHQGPHSRVSPDPRAEITLGGGGNAA